MISTIKISQLPLASPLTGAENIIVNQSSSTRLSTISDVVGLVTVPSIVGLASEGYVDNKVAISTSGLLSSSGNGSNLTGIVTTITAGSGISIDQSAGNVTITNTGGGGGGIVGLTIKDENVNVGTAGSVTTLNFVGGNITAIASGTASTITITPQTYVDTAGVSTVSQGLTGNPNISVGIVTSLSFVRIGGSSTEFLKSDGSIDSSTYATQTFVGLSTSGLASVSYVDNLVAISTFSGDYNDLINTPTIPSIVGLASEGYVDNKVAISTSGLLSASVIGGGTTGQVFTKISSTDYDADWSSLTDVFIIACSDETSNLTAGTNKARFTMPYAGTLTAVKCDVNTAPTGSTLVVDINEAGVSVLSTKLSIDAGETSSSTAATPPVISDSALANGAVISIDIDQIGSTVAGAGLKVTLFVTRS